MAIGENDCQLWFVKDTDAYLVAGVTNSESGLETVERDQEVLQYPLAGFLEFH